MVRLIIWVVVGLLALSFFGISLRGLVENPTNQDNLSFVFAMVESGWHMILAWLSTIPDWFGDLWSQHS